MLRGRQTGLDRSAVQTPAPLKPAKRPHRNESRPRVTCERRGLVSVHLAEGGCVGSFSSEGFLGPSGGILRSCLSVPFTSAPTHVFEQEQWQSGPSRCRKWQAVSEKRHDCVHTGPRGVRMSLRSYSTVRKPSSAPNKQTNKQTRGNRNSVPGIQSLLWERYSFSFQSWRKGWKRRRKSPRNGKMRDRRPAGGRRARGLGNKRPLLDLLGYFFFFLEKILHRPLYSRRRLVSKLFTGVTNLIELQIREATWMLSHVASI